MGSTEGAATAWRDSTPDLGQSRQEPAEVLRGEARGHGAGRAGVEEVQAHLGGVQHACIDHPRQGRGFAQRGDADEARLARLAQLAQRRHHLFQHLLGVEPAGVLGIDEVMELEQVHAVHLQPLEARIE